MSARHMLVNAVTRTLAGMFPGFFTPKHNHYADFGYPEQVTFDLAYQAYTRNGIGAAGVNKTVEKTWQDAPWLQEFARDDGDDTPETKLEKEIRDRFAELRVWQQLAEAERRGLVGAYSGVILRLADGKQFREPVKRVPGGLSGLVEVIPAWEGQLKVSQWDTDERSATYGQPKMFSFNEAAVGDAVQPRTLEIHPDRIVIWSKDGSVNGRSLLEPGYNDLLTLEKISGAGGEGFWKNAKSGLSLEIDKDAKIEDMARAMGVQPEEVVDRMDEQVESFNKGFDKSILLQGITAKPMQVTLPSPEHFWAAPLQSFAASISMPMKILVGSQSGERASTEDAAEWNKTAMSRRTGFTIPNIMTFVRRLVRFSILPERDWHLDWADLTETSQEAKIALADKMADVNQKMKDTGEVVFTPEEMRGVTGREPLSDAEKYRDDEEDDADALGAITKPEDEPAKAA
ncbi:anti-CBASS protein Acb1 family protein [Brevundimonas sp. FT23028]|uniref:anti-CBASS protein Acb1 family protein n=1 Tax=Brevundimonas sp. FT23028 TaxID=3393748 RepID=UPI003B588E58